MRAVLWTSAVLISTLTIVGCSSNSNPSNPSTGGSTPLTISIVGQLGNASFSPNPADAGGKTVVFKNNDNVTHHVVLNDGTLDVGDIAPGATSRAITMPTGGTNYHCSIHPNMGGAVDPQGGGAPPPCEGVYCY